MPPCVPPFGNQAHPPPRQRMGPTERHLFNMLSSSQCKSIQQECNNSGWAEYGRLHSAVPFLNLKTQGTNLHALERHLPRQATSKHSLPDACLSGISSEPLLAFPRDSLYRTPCTPRRRCVIAQLTCPKLYSHAGHARP